MIELFESVQDKLPFVNENIDLVLQKFLAVLLHFFWHRRTEHHDLFFVRSFNKNILDICSHAGTC